MEKMLKATIARLIEHGTGYKCIKVHTLTYDRHLKFYRFQWSAYDMTDPDHSRVIIDTGFVIHTGAVYIDSLKKYV